MNREQILKIKLKLRGLDDGSLALIFALALNETHRRGVKLGNIPKYLGFWETKDCEPNPGD